MTNEAAAHIESMKTLDQMLPYRFELTGSEIKKISVSCSKCNSDINEKDIRGEFSATNQHSTALEAYAVCFAPGCRTITPLVCRFGDDGTYLSQSNGCWVPGRYAPVQQAGWLSKIKAIIFGGNNE